MMQIIVETQQEVCLNYLDSILSLLPLCKTLYEENTQEDEGTILHVGSVSDTMIALYSKLNEGQKNLNAYCNEMRTTIETVLIPGIRASIHASLSMHDDDVSAVSAIESYVIHPGYVKKSNSRIMRYNCDHEIAMENHYIIDSAQEYWYTVVVKPDTIIIEKEDAAVVTLQNIIDNKCSELLKVCEDLLMYIDNYEKIVEATIFSSDAIATLNDIIHGEGEVADAISCVPNPAVIDHIYKDITLINSAINAVGIDTNIAIKLIGAQIELIRATMPL